MEREERIRHQKEFLIKFAYWAVWGGLVLAAVKLIGPVLLPFIAAFFVAWILSFPVVFVTERMHIRRGIAAVAVVLLFYGLAGLLIGFLGNRIMLLGQELLGEVVRFVSETIFPMMKHFCAWTAGMSGETVGGEVLRTAGTESAEAVSRAGELLTGMSGTLLQQVSGIAVNIPGMCFKLLLAVISTVFMELDFPQIMRFLEKNIPEKWKETVLAVKKGTFGTMGKCAAAYVFIFLMTSMAFLRALRISTLVSSPIFLICLTSSFLRSSVMTGNTMRMTLPSFVGVSPRLDCRMAFSTAFNSDLSHREICRHLASSALTLPSSMSSTTRVSAR